MDVPSTDIGLIQLFEEQYAGYYEPATLLIALRNRLREQGHGNIRLTVPADLALLEGEAAQAARRIIPTLQSRFNDDAAAALL